MVIYLLEKETLKICFLRKKTHKPDSSKKFLGNRALWPSDGGVDGSVSPFNGQTRRNLQINISKEEKN